MYTPFITVVGMRGVSRSVCRCLPFPSEQIINIQRGGGMMALYSRAGSSSPRSVAPKPRNRLGSPCYAIPEQPSAALFRSQTQIDKVPGLKEKLPSFLRPNIIPSHGLCPSPSPCVPAGRIAFGTISPRDRYRMRTLSATTLSHHL